MSNLFTDNRQIEAAVAAVLFIGSILLPFTHSLPEMTQQLANAQNQYQDLGVIIRGDGEGAYKNVAKVLAACREAGIAEMGVAVRIGEGE